MANATAERATDQLGQNSILQQIVVLVKGGTKILAGTHVDLDATGYAVPAAANTTGRAMGRAESTVDNTAGLDGALKLIVRRGCFKWANSASADLIDNTKIGLDCYAVDNQTVALTSGGSTRHQAGKIVYVDTDGGVFVETKFY